MIDKIVNLSLDSSAPPVFIHATQGDTMWRWHFRIFYESLRWTIPENSNIHFSGIKEDGNVFDISGHLNENEAIVDCEIQVTAIAGKVPSIITIIDTAGEIIATCGVILLVARDPKGAGTISESALTAYDELLSDAQVILDAANNLVGITASATTLASGASATANVTGGTDGTPYRINIGVPKGDKGDKGDKGEKGDPGADGDGAVNSVDGVASIGGDVPLGAVRYADKGTTKLCDLIYPVGSIYMAVNNVSPSTLFGGTWERISDRFLLAAGTKYEAGSTGGSESVTISADNLPAHNHEVLVDPPVSGASTLYDHAGLYPSSNVNWASSAGASGPGVGTSVTTSDNKALFVTDGAYSESPNAISIMPPYLAVYVWKRTA